MGLRKRTWGGGSFQVNGTILLLLFGCAGSALLCEAFLQLQQVETTLCCSTRASLCGGVSYCGARALGTQAQQLRLMGSSVRLSSCGALAYLPRGMWHLPRPGTEPMSPALACRFLFTASPGNYCILVFKLNMFYEYYF